MSLILGEMNVTTVGKDLITILGINSKKYVCMNSENGGIYVSVSNSNIQYISVLSLLAIIALLFERKQEESCFYKIRNTRRNR